MTGSGKIQLGQPEWEYRPYTHLLPLVDDLIRRGNRLARTGQDGQAFFGNQDGYNAYLAEPLDIEYVRATYDLPGFGYDPAEDSLFDSRNWVTIYGSDARLAMPRRPPRRERTMSALGRLAAAARRTTHRRPPAG